MDYFEQIIQRFTNFDIGVSDILDIAIVAYIIYITLRYLRRTNSANVFKGIGLLVAFLWLSTALDLNVVSFLLGKTVELGVLALVVLFQPEIRQALSKMGNNSVMRFFRPDSGLNTIDTAITQIVLASSQMSMTRTGALIVFERDIKLDEVIRSGTYIDSHVNAELIKNIFFRNSPLHDGAMIIRDGRIVSAACVLPNSTNANISRELGTRHRAAVGITEKSDAIVIVISEETGAISVAVDGMLKRHLTQETLEKLLLKELLKESSSTDKNSLIKMLRKRFKGREENG